MLCSPGHCKTSLAKPVVHSSSLELKPQGHLSLFIFQSSPSSHSRAVSSCQKRSHFPEDMYLSHTYLRTADSETKDLRHKPFQAEFVPRLKSLKRNLDVLDFPHTAARTNKQTASVVVGHREKLLSLIYVHRGFIIVTQNFILALF